ncbi:MAG: hypothetical protein JSR44_09660 [Spirochaetes bacterium]|nr:hypothetical protein [Spirochaetota bacterium]
MFADNHNPTPQQRAQNLIREFVEYNEKYAAQIPLAIPKGTLKTIDYYRDTYFRYLKDSEFKSNICYMLQLIEYELWQYKLFKPQFSLENALFFQLFVTQGIVIEAVIFALIANPLVVSDTADRSKGATDAEHANLLNMIRRRTFAAHIQQLRTTNIIAPELCDAIDRFRSEIRNLVHLQNWEGRLYRQISQPDYAKHLGNFDTILKSLNDAVTTPHDLAGLLAYYALDGRELSGTVKFYNRNSGRGQIECKAPHDYIPFFREDFTEELSPRKGERLSFELAVTEQGVRALRITAG